MLKVRHEAFKYYFYFMKERMKIFHHQYNCNHKFKTQDPILLQYKFTNVYRACDRVSQYLISQIIGFKNRNMSDLDIALNIVLFKVFNNIQTWEYIQNNYGNIYIENFDYKKISLLLTKRNRNNAIFNGAYIMTASSHKYRHHTYKHKRWLNMIDKELINGRKLEKLLESKSMSEAYDILKSCTFIGPFLAYQYVIDLNYSNVINFSENSFVKAGIGAIRGIKKCFIDVNNKSYEYIIQHTHENIEKYSERYEYSFDTLFGRPATLIDLQNCFCETDKYLRVKKPELNLCNTRIKQKYKKNKNVINYTFPEKWNLITKNERYSL